MQLRCLPRLYFACVVALLLAGCATAPATPTEIGWAPEENWWAEAGRSGGWVPRRDGSSIRIRSAHLRNLYEVSQKIQEQSGITGQIAFLDTDELNAYAIEFNGVRQIAFSLPLLEAISDDRDALATTIGHEAAHLHYAHEAARKARNQLTMGDSPAIRGILTVNSTFSRYEEREADIKGMEWTIAAGFSPCGAARTMRTIRALGGDTSENSFLSMHPGHGERIARATTLAMRLDGRRC